MSPTEPFRRIFPLRDGPNDSLLPSASPERLQSSPAGSLFQTLPRPGGVFVRFPTTRAGVTPWEPAAARSRTAWLTLPSLELVSQGRGIVQLAQRLNDGATVDGHGAVVHLVVHIVANQAFDVSIENQPYQLALLVDDRGP